MRKMFAAGVIFCSSVPVLQAQELPPHYPVADVKWVGSGVRPVAPLPTINPNVVLTAVPYPAAPAPTRVVVTQLEMAVPKGESKGPGRTMPTRSEVVVPTPLPSGVVVLPETTLTLTRMQGEPPVPRLPDSPKVPVAPPTAPMTHGQPIPMPIPSQGIPLPAETIYTVPSPHTIAQPLPIATSGPYGTPLMNGGAMYTTMPEGWCSDGSCAPAKTHCMWLNAEMVYWWTKNGPQDFPLVTSGSPAAGALAGALGQPGTRVLFGGSGLEYDGVWGLRTEIGMWFDQQNTIGFSAGGFGTQNGTTHFLAGDNGTSAAGLYIPAVNAAGVPFENRLLIADAPLAFAGGVTIRSTSQIWGADANMLFNIYRGPALELTPFVGFRHISLTENLTIDTTNTDLLFGTVTTTTDSFKTRSHLYGGQLGVHANLTCGNWTVGVTSKVALGFTHNVLKVSGSSIQAGALAPTPGAFDSGFFAQATNSGRTTHDNFAVVPEVNAKLSYNVARWLVAHVGYDFMYWNAVVRPGAQVNRNLNLTQSPIFGANALAGVAQPSSLFRTSDYYLHGLSAGLEFRY